MAFVGWVKGPVQGEGPIAHQLGVYIHLDRALSLAVEVVDLSGNIGKEETLRLHICLQSLLVTDRSPGNGDGIDPKVHLQIAKGLVVEFFMGGIVRQRSEEHTSELQSRE